MVDDEYFISDLLKSSLSDLGYTVDVATNERSMRKQIEANRPDLIILDINLPGMDGIEINNMLHSNKSTAPIPVLMLSADRRLPQKASRMQIENWMAKPFDLDSLTAKVEAMLGGS